MSPTNLGVPLRERERVCDCQPVAVHLKVRRPAGRRTAAPRRAAGGAVWSWLVGAEASVASWISLQPTLEHPLCMLRPPHPCPATRHSAHSLRRNQQQLDGRAPSKEQHQLQQRAAIVLAAPRVCCLRLRIACSRYCPSRIPAPPPLAHLELMESVSRADEQRLRTGRRGVCC